MRAFFLVETRKQKKTSTREKIKNTPLSTLGRQRVRLSSQLGIPCSFFVVVFLSVSSSSTELVLKRAAEQRLFFSFLFPIKRKMTIYAVAPLPPPLPLASQSTAPPARARARAAGCRAPCPSASGLSRRKVRKEKEKENAFSFFRSTSLLARCLSIFPPRFSWLCTFCLSDFDVCTSLRSKARAGALAEDAKGLSQCLVEAK